MRHQVQNYSIELRAINDKRELERQELAIAKEKLAESIANMRQMQSGAENVKIEMANAVNMRQSLEKLQA